MKRHLVTERAVRKTSKQSPTLADESGTAAIWIVNSGMVLILGQGRGNGFILVRRRDHFLLYLTPNQSISDYRWMLNSLENEIRITTGGSLFAVDSNVRAIDCGMPHTNTRRRYILHLYIILD